MDKDTSVRQATPEQSKAHLDMLFKGYIPVNPDKSTYAPWKKDTSCYQTYDSICSKNGYGGILKDDILVVDVDDEWTGEQILKAIKELGVRTRVHKTTKGYHFFFKRGTDDVKDRQTKLTPAIGLGWHKGVADKGRNAGQEVIIGDVDYLAGWSGAMLILKLAGVPREVVYETEDIGTCPRWLQPLQERGQNCHPVTYDLLGLGDGDGRNQVMTSLMAVLKNRGYSWEEAEETAWVVNHFTFSEPMDDGEFEIVTRRERYDSLEVSAGKGRGRPRGSVNKDSKAPYDSDMVISRLREDYHLRNIGGVAYVYHNGCYVKKTDVVGNRIVRIAGELNMKFTHAQVKDTIKLATMYYPEWDETAPPELIVFKNGILNIKTGEMMEHNPDVVVTNLIPHNYNPQAYSKCVDEALDAWACGDPDVRAVLEEMVGYSFYRKADGQKSFLLVGNGSNGKSSFLTLAMDVLGVDNFSALGLKDLGSQFRPAALRGVLANFGDDIDDGWVSDTSAFKKFVTADYQMIESKGVDAEKMRIGATMIFSANKVPGMSEAGKAIQRRWVLIPFNADFTVSDAVRENESGATSSLEECLKTEEALEYMTRLAVEGLKRVLSRKNTFSSNTEMKAMLAEMAKNNDSLVEYVEDELGGVESILYEPAKTVYQQYKDWCHEDALRPPCKYKEFRDRMKSKYGLTVEKRQRNLDRCNMFVPVQDQRI